MELEQDIDPKQACYERAQQMEDDSDSVDSFDSKYADTKLGIFEVDEQQIKGEYLPKLRKRNDMTLVPIESIMKKASAPNQRCETINNMLATELKGKDDDEKLFELL